MQNSMEAESALTERLEQFAALLRQTQSGCGPFLIDVPLACVFFFQAEDGIRDLTVTGVQTCALPIFGGHGTWGPPAQALTRRWRRRWSGAPAAFDTPAVTQPQQRSTSERPRSAPTRPDRKSVV